MLRLDDAARHVIAAARNSRTPAPSTHLRISARPRDSPSGPSKTTSSVQAAAAVAPSLLFSAREGESFRRSEKQDSRAHIAPPDGGPATHRRLKGCCSGEHEALSHGYPVARIAVVLAAAITTTLAVTAAYGTLSSPIRQSGQGPSIYVIGDSWSAGLFADPQHTLAQDAADDLGLQSIVHAQSGTGYVNAPPGTETYAQRAAEIPAGTRADLVVLQGGSNDDGTAPATLLKAVAQTVTAARHAIPGATVVLLGPGPDPWPVTPSQTVVDCVLRLDALRQHVPYISPMQDGWFTSSNVATIIDPITAHPTIRGDETLGQRLANELRVLVKKPNRPAPQSRRPQPQDSRLHVVGDLGRPRSARQLLAVTG
jgi:hypothetical protein